ncbi:hypothetical protein [Nonomuraea recticatena]|uniref:Uncharacterized protein n=1 Tax=Nonomuraea recticatena TaxID=46178 RepID=A0ABP6FQ56_9ACTN
MPKLTAMTAVNQSLQSTSLSRARIWNPFPSLAEGSTATFSAPPELSPKVPEVIEDSRVFGTASRNEKIAAAAAAKNCGLLDGQLEWSTLTAPVFEQLRTRLKIDYLKHGAESIKDFSSGVCTMFACAALGHLARNHNLLDPGSVVELFKYDGGQGGHAFIVVNRAGTPDDVDSWGPQCYVIDPWYARHRITAPGTNAVKDMTAGTAFHDPAFVAFLKDANSRAVQVTFPHMQLIQAFS